MAVAQAPGAAGLSYASRAQASHLVEGAWRREDARAASVLDDQGNASAGTSSAAPAFSPRDPAVQRESAAARAVDVAARLEAALPGSNVPFRFKIDGIMHPAPVGHPHAGIVQTERQGWIDFPAGVVVGQRGDAMGDTRAQWDARILNEFKRMGEASDARAVERDGREKSSSVKRPDDVMDLTFLPETCGSAWMPLWDATNVVEAMAKVKRGKKPLGWRAVGTRVAHAELGRECGRSCGWSGGSEGGLGDALRQGLGAGTRQTGVDDELHSWFKEARAAQGAQVAARCYPPACRLFARRGCPPGVRPLVWRGALGLTSGGAGEVRGEVRGLTPERRWEASGAGRQGSVKDRQDVYFTALSKQVLRSRLLVDYLASLDCSTAVRCHEDYFVYEPVCRIVMACMSRDGWIRERCRARVHPDIRLDVDKGELEDLGPACLVLAPDEATADAKSSEVQRVRKLPAYPPSGVVPFRGLSLLIAPLCYLYDDPADVYFAFRALYTRHFCFLGSLDAGDGRAAPALARLFEDLLADLEPLVFQHLRALNLSPLSIAYPWIFSAFAGFLAIEQLLLLWDRVVGFDSLVPLVLLAVAIFGFKRDQIMACADPADAVGIFGRSLRSIRVVPLLQAVVDAMFPESPT